MRITCVILVACGLYFMGVASQQQPVVVEVEGLFGRYGGYYLAAAILLSAYINARNSGSDGTTFNINGETMVASNGNGNGNGPTPIGR